jgi:squalene-hopene/tetraprenyl-beta-curcumene cyclase
LLVCAQLNQDHGHLTAMANDYSPAHSFAADATAASPAGAHNFRAAMQSTMRSAAGWLIEQQKPDGHWVGRAESNSCMEAQWCLALWFMGLGDHPLRRGQQRAVADIASGWRLQIYHDAPAATSIRRLKPVRRCVLSTATTSRLRGAWWVGQERLRKIRVSPGTGWR